MNKISKHCTVLELLVLLFLGEGFSCAKASFASVRNEVSSRSIAMTTMAAKNREAAMYTVDNHPRETNTTISTVPLIDIGTQTGPNLEGSSTSRTNETELSRALVSALQDSGFALVRSPLLTKELQSKALEAASHFLAAPPKTSKDPVTVDVTEHPTDPKVYSMLDSDAQFDFVAPDHTLKEYVRALRRIKMEILRLIAIGLGMSDTGFFAKLHDEHHDTLRLITYHPTHSEDTGNRCKEHSDYGTITLLSTDGVSGLELLRDGTWMPVPFVEGALVVNVGSLLAEWTKGSLKATLHRVAGPASSNSRSDKSVLLEAVHHPRTSVAFFADPNQGVSESLEATATAAKNNSIEIETFRDLTDALGGLSVVEYIRWRSGGDGAERSGVSFTAKETELLHPK